MVAPEVEPAQIHRGMEVTDMLKVNETVTGLDLAEMVRDESGIFEAISPNGEKYQVICRSGYSITNFRPVQAKSHEKQSSPWRVRKIGELRLEQETV